MMKEIQSSICSDSRRYGTTKRLRNPHQRESRSSGSDCNRCQSLYNFLNITSMIPLWCLIVSLSILCYSVPYATATFVSTSTTTALLHSKTTFQPELWGITTKPHPSVSEPKQNPIISRMTQRYMSSTTSQTGSRLIESVEEYATVIRNMNQQPYQHQDDHNQEQQQDVIVERPILLFWTAPWCGPCRLTVPIVKAIRKRYVHDIDTIEICTDDLPDLASAVGVTSVPTIHLYYQGKLLDTLVGCVTQQVLAGSIDKVLEDIQKMMIAHNQQQQRGQYHHHQLHTTVLAPSSLSNRRHEMVEDMAP